MCNRKQSVLFKDIRKDGVIKRYYGNVQCDAVLWAIFRHRCSSQSLEVNRKIAAIAIHAFTMHTPKNRKKDPSGRVWEIPRVRISIIKLNTTNNL